MNDGFVSAIPSPIRKTDQSYMYIYRTSTLSIKSIFLQIQ